MASPPAPGGTPAHEVVARKLRALILTGRYAPGDRLPTEPELERQMKVSRITVRGGTAMLVADRLIRVAQGFGTQVRDWLRDGSFELFASVLTVHQGTPEAAERMRQLLWLRRTLYVALAPLVCRAGTDLGPLRIHVGPLSIPFVAGRTPRALDVLRDEELALCEVAELSDNAAAILLAHSIRRALLMTADNTAADLKLQDGSERFRGLLDALIHHRADRTAKLLGTVCQVRERAYVELSLQRPHG